MTRADDLYDEFVAHLDRGDQARPLPGSPEFEQVYLWAQDRVGFDLVTAMLRALRDGDFSLQFCAFALLNALDDVNATFDHEPDGTFVWRITMETTITPTDQGAKGLR